MSAKCQYFFLRAGTNNVMMLSISEGQFNYATNAFFSACVCISEDNMPIGFGTFENNGDSLRLLALYDVDRDSVEYPITPIGDERRAVAQNLLNQVLALGDITPDIFYKIIPGGTVVR